MSRILLLSVSVLLIAGCASQPKPMEMGPPVKPEPAPELAVLEKFVGTWAGTAEMLTPMPGAPEDMPDTFRGESRSRWDLSGMFLRSEGWHEMGPGERMRYVEYWTWDPEAGNFRTWYFSDWGEHGAGSATVSDDGNTFTVKAKGSDAAGNRTTGHGSLTFTDRNTMDWTWTESGPDGKMEFRGTSRRR